jgi:hypothetical protein
MTLAFAKASCRNNSALPFASSHSIGVKLKPRVAECNFIAIPQRFFTDNAAEGRRPDMAEKGPVLRAEVPNNPTTTVFISDFGVVC